MTNAQRMVNLWNRLIQYNPIPFVPKLRFELFTEVDDGLILRKEKIDDDKYFFKNYLEYLDDLEDFATDPDLYKQFKKPSGKKQVEQFQKIWIKEMEQVFQEHCFKK